MGKFKHLILSAFLLFSAVAYADVPELINYQGKLTDSVGNPLNETAQVDFAIYDVEIDGTALWTESHLGITVVDGVFSVILGSVDQASNPLDLAFDKVYYLEITVNGETMDPRQKMTSVAYSMRAKETDALPSGIIIMCRNQCPAGYTRVSEFDGKALVAGAAYDPNAGSSTNAAELDSWGKENYAGGSSDSDDWILAPVVTHNDKLYASMGKKGWHSIAKSSPNLEVVPHSSTTEFDLKKAKSTTSSGMDYGTIFLCEKN